MGPPTEYSHGSSDIGDTELIAGARRQYDALPPVPGVGQRIGRYEVIDVLGRGGMGVVYRARQADTQRLVALKLIRPELMSPSRRRRFAREVRLLGRLQHPGIAAIYEADVAGTDQGEQPYFTMELVQGRPLRKYAEEHSLTTAQRLELLARLCDAVEHAHRRGVVHRDLKPANILVDESGQPRILDFGVARATSPDWSANSQTADAVSVVGTLAYMSPEQLLGDAAEADTRCDVYALGVVGFELLAGRLPFDMTGCSLAEVVRLVQQEEPLPLGRVEARWRGEVETIIARALEKSPEQRYQSAAALAADLRHHLRHEPIEALPPSAVCRLRKFVRRHQALSAALVCGVLGLVGTVVGTSVGMVRAAEARRHAETEARTAERVSEFLVNLFRSADPAEGARDLTAEALLHRGVEKVEADLGSEPQVQAAMYHVLARTHLQLGLYDEAKRCAQAALDIRERTLGARHPDVAATLDVLARALEDTGQMADAEAAARRAVALTGELHGPNDMHTLDAQGTLSDVLAAQGKYAEAEEIQRHVVEQFQQVLSPDDDRTTQALHNLAALLINAGRLAEAEPVCREVLALRQRTLGSEHTRTLTAMNNLAVLERRLGHLSEGAVLLRDVVVGRRNALGPSHPRTLTSMSNLVTVLLDLREYDEADQVSAELVALLEQQPAEQRGLSWPQALHARAQTLAALARLDEAEPLSREAAAAFEQVHGPDHRTTHSATLGLAAILMRREAHEEAEALVRRVYANQLRTLGPEHNATLFTQLRLGEVLVERGALVEAEQTLRESLAILERMLPDHWWVGFAQSELGGVLLALDCRDEAGPLLNSAVERLERELGATDIRVRQAVERLELFHELEGDGGDSAGVEPARVDHEGS